MGRVRLPGIHDMIENKALVRPEHGVYDQPTKKAGNVNYSPIANIRSY